MMELISVDSAKHTDSAALELIVTYTDDAGEQRTDPYGWLAGDPHGLGPQVDAWMAAHPDFPIADYVAPVPSTNPADYTLSKRQICAALIISGTTDDPDGFVRGVLATISDAQAKALAINDWNYAPYYTRTNALFNDPSLLGASGITPEQIDQFWLLGAQQPA